MDSTSLRVSAADRRRWVIAASILLVLVVFSVALTPATWWAFVGDAGQVTSTERPVRIAGVWLVAWIGPVIVCAASRSAGRSNGAPLPASWVRRCVPWLGMAMAVWFGFVLWLGAIGAGFEPRVPAFAVVLTCATFLTPMSLLGAALRPRWLVWALPLALMTFSAIMYLVLRAEMFGV